VKRMDFFMVLDEDLHKIDKIHRKNTGSL
jgi:hypothetical protein